MKKISILLATALLSFAVKAQQVNWKKLNELKPDKILLAGERQPTKVLLLGTFHFNYPNLDGHKTDSAQFIDVLSTQRQNEIKELAEVIKRFNPTRLYIESTNSAYHDSLYNEYKNNRYLPGRNEIYQLAYRVAKDMGLKKVYAVDASNFASENYNRYSWIDSLWNLENNVDTVRDQYWGRKYKQFYNAADSIEKSLTMLENFLLMAEPETLNRMHGAYFTSGFNTTGNNGPDMLAMWWYSRNLRIINNILSTKPTGDDRIMVLFGNGHVPILKHCFQSSPEFELVELKSLLKK